MERGAMIIIPKHVQIEPVNGYCSSDCQMCTLKQIKRKPNIMSVDTFEHILKKLIPFTQQIKFLSMTGMGESLLDRNLSKKIRLAKELKFQGIGFTTNCTELNEARSKEILHAGLDTLICSIDGIHKKTHELIRQGTDFDKVVGNVKNFLRIRNQLKVSTKVRIRFVRQKINQHEWPEFANFWNTQISKDLGDIVVKFDVINWGGTLENYDKLAADNSNIDISTNFICEDIFERMWIYSNGEVSLCCGDDSGFYKMGNVIDSDPIEIYNNKTFNHYRKMMNNKKFFELKHCRECKIPMARELENHGSQTKRE